MSVTFTADCSIKSFMGKLQAWIPTTFYYFKHKIEGKLNMLIYYDIYEACIVTLKQ
jgi:hypothetical protein